MKRTRSPTSEDTSEPFVSILEEYQIWEIRVETIQLVERWRRHKIFDDYRDGIDSIAKEMGAGYQDVQSPFVFANPWIQ